MQFHLAPFLGHLATPSLFDRYLTITQLGDLNGGRAKRGCDRILVDE
ncbi:MAG: hypothetical protein HC780_11585 [Leptolyngbyaceae cyanobacterium CSU_1_3]|nr:hypothetical protein [Leptolyngbyaceae cyanobacterium CSU_1_3]